MKKFTLLSLLLIMTLTLGLVSCKANRAKDSVNLKGKWYSVSENLNEFMIIKEDHTVTAYRKDKAGRQLWENVPGNIEVEGNNISLKFENGHNATGTFLLEENKLTISTSYGTYSYTRLSDHYNLEGEWEVYSIVCDMDAIKDKIELPSGEMADGTEVPAELETSDLNGEFMNFAIKQYFNNIKFSNNQLYYTVIKEGQDVTMNKKYTLGDIDMTLSGEVAGYSIMTKIMMVQTADEAVLAIPLTKDNIADMFVGYAIMLAQGGMSTYPDDAELEAFRKSFVDAFTFFNVTLRLKRK